MKSEKKLDRKEKKRKKSEKLSNIVEIDDKKIKFPLKNI